MNNIGHVLRFCRFLSSLRYVVWRIFALLACLLFAVGAAPVHDPKPTTAVDFSNKTIEFTVPFMPGGGTDTWARSVLPLLSRYLPGNPEIVIRNVAGGSATKAANDYAIQNQLDGLSLLVTGASNHLAYMLGDDRVRYDFTQWRALMAYSAGVVVYTSPREEVSNIWELLEKKDRQLVLASIGPASEDIFVLLALDILDIDVSTVFGLRGRGSARKFYERGDANIDFQTTAAYMAYVKPQADAGRAVPLFSLGAFDQERNYIRDPMAPDLPNLAEVYERAHGRTPTGEAWDAWMALYSAGLGSLKLIVVPQETPEPIIAAYTQAIEELKNDKQYTDALSELVGPEGIVGAQQAAELLHSRVNLSLETRQWLIDWIYEKYQVRL